MKTRLQLNISGAVQGVGFRPFIFHLAEKYHLKGYVKNTRSGVLLEAEGPENQVQEFLIQLPKNKPPHAFIQGMEPLFLEPFGYDSFRIDSSQTIAKDPTAIVLPDMATCLECTAEIKDPQNRRYRYPFTNCTHCGPRYSILLDLPYDRPHTTMHSFTMCTTCQAEYNDPKDRRFHAQPNACPECGPQLSFWEPEGQVLGQADEALQLALEKLREGCIIAVKGLGGFHLMVDPTNNDAVLELRKRKKREEKPFALFFPSLKDIQSICTVHPLEERALLASEAPIVLLQRLLENSHLSSEIAPGNPCLGVMLPYTPLHILLLDGFQGPLIATSGNLDAEPIVTCEQEALKRLHGIADYFLVHNRPIKRHVDDSIVRIINGREMMLRRARGYAPMPIENNREIPPTLAVGGHLKNTIAVSKKQQLFVSQHIGDLDEPKAREVFVDTINDLLHLYQIQPEQLLCDLHPDYASTQHAMNLASPQYIQHHMAHVFAGILDNRVNLPCLGVAWDGTGYGTDGTLWGGEWFLVQEGHIEHFARLRSFLLPGGDLAAREPRRAALGLLYTFFGEEIFKWTELPSIQSFRKKELGVLRQTLGRQQGTIWTSSAGRYFDAVASLTGLRQINNFEGQAAMGLEWTLDADSASLPAYPLEWTPPEPEKSVAGMINMKPMIMNILKDVRSELEPQVIASKFHNTLVDALFQVAQAAGCPRIVFSGGCFQNRYLVEQTYLRLKEEGYHVYFPQRLPPNDGCIAAGQIAAVEYFKTLA